MDYGIYFIIISTCSRIAVACAIYVTVFWSTHARGNVKVCVTREVNHILCSVLRLCIKYFNKICFTQELFLSTFEKLWKVIISLSCLSVFLSVHPHGTTRLPLDRFSWNLIFEDFFKMAGMSLSNNWDTMCP